MSLNVIPYTHIKSVFSPDTPAWNVFSVYIWIQLSEDGCVNGFDSLKVLPSAVQTQD